jgi:CubicO group peptidase (beta-lactamase class C family)
MGKARFAQADAVVRAALGVRFTAAQLRIEQAGRVVFERAYGFTDESAHVPVYVTTLFDLASLTKPFIAYAILREVEAKRLSLDGFLCDIIPEWRACAHETITTRMLLTHASGMQSGAHYRTLLNDAVTHYALTRPLVVAPGEQVLYSDLGFIALGVLLERVRGCSLTTLITHAARAIGANGLLYRPDARDILRIPATEEDDWRGRVRGVVHDEKAYLMGGAAGHAGLFGTARDVAALTEVFLGALCGREAKFLTRETVREATTGQAEDALLRRGLGWMLKKRNDNSCGALASRESFGHTGFTGTCVWADPVRDVQIAFLTNAVYFGRKELRDVRIAVCDAVFAEVSA